MSTNHSKPLQFRRRNRSLNKHQSPVAAIRHISMIPHKTTTILEPLQIRTHTHQIMTGRSRLKVLDGWQSQVSRLECFLEEMSVFSTNSHLSVSRFVMDSRTSPKRSGGISSLLPMLRLLFLLSRSIPSQDQSIRRPLRLEASRACADWRESMGVLHRG
jgi:hypothetical protein